MQYAPAAHWDHVFRTLRQASADLDWGEQWVGAFAPILHTHHVQRLLDLGCGTGNDVQRLAQCGYTVVGLDDSREAITQAARKAGSQRARWPKLPTGISMRSAYSSAKHERSSQTKSHQSA